MSERNSERDSTLRVQDNDDIVLVDGEEILVHTPEEHTRVYTATNLTRAFSAYQDGLSKHRAGKKFTFDVLVSHKRELVIETTEIGEPEEVVRPPSDSDRASTAYSIAVARFLGYEPLGYTVSRQDVQNIKYLIEELDSMGWSEIMFLKQLTERFGTIEAAAEELDNNTGNE